MEESPPPVPLKDASTREGSSRPQTAASGSKRKRGQQDYDFRNGSLDDVDLHGQTPKRSRSHLTASDHEGYISTDETPLQARSVRRKRGAQNLSAMNLRHAASAQALTQRHESPIRESRFQEGSLTDKPSGEPPSMYTRLPHAHSGTLSYREELMENYQDGIPTPRDSVEAQLQHETDTRNQGVAEIAAQQKKEDNSGVFRFGKSLASTFHPVSLWNRLWNEQKDELTRQSMEEADRKAKLKLEAEAKYAEMKDSGSFGLRPVHLEQSRDSGIAIGDTLSWQAQGLSTPLLSGRRAEARHRKGGELADSTSKPLLRSVRSRFHLRKPSLQNLQQSIRRVASYANIGDQQDRDSSTSLSPTKGDFPEHTLLKSASKYDLKRQQKLSKRVSDLEARLNKARNDLDEALVQASPEVRFGSKFQRFTPSNTLWKPKFVPGALATLPSEGVLFPQQSNNYQSNGEAHQVRPRIIVDPAMAFSDIDEDEETIRAPREKSYRVCAKEVFQQSEGFDQQVRDDDQEPNELAQEVKQEIPISEAVTGSSGPDYNTANIAPGSKPLSDAQDPLINASDATSNSPKGDANSGKKPQKSKKRPARGGGDRVFKPGVDDDDDAECEEAAQQSKKKKRKSDVDLADSPKNKSPGNKTRKGGQTKTTRKSVQVKPTVDKHVDANDDGSEDELTRMVSRRTSIASEDVTLEPVYEEEEESTMVPLKDAPSKPTAKATPARFGYNGVRSRSNSPQKHVEDGSTMTRVANAAHVQRPSLSASPGSRGQDLASSGKVDAALLPKTTNGTVRLINANHVKTKENFEWPDDVF